MNAVHPRHLAVGLQHGQGQTVACAVALHQGDPASTRGGGQEAQDPAGLAQDQHVSTWKPGWWQGGRGQGQVLDEARSPVT